MCCCYVDSIYCVGNHICQIAIWVIPYQFTKVLHMTHSELDKSWCVGSPGGRIFPKGITPPLIVWLPRYGLLNIEIIFHYVCGYLLDIHLLNVKVSAWGLIGIMRKSFLCSGVYSIIAEIPCSIACLEVHSAALGLHMHKICMHTLALRL